MSWHGHLQLNYRHDPGEDRTHAHDRHRGPLRVLQRLYPEGPSVCHHVLVHPPGGIVGGDTLEVDLDLAPGSHALITTPGATRYYRSESAVARQQVRARLAEGTRLEWLPLETIAYDACIAENSLRFELSPGAMMMGWDLLALGLPAAGLPWQRGSYLQQLELPGVWLERARIRADDKQLLESPLGWSGRSVLGTFWLAAGEALPKALSDALIEHTRVLIQASPLAGQAGVCTPHANTVVLRVLADRVEPAMQLMTTIWASWRSMAWGLDSCPPRVWRT